MSYDGEPGRIIIIIIIIIILTRPNTVHPCPQSLHTPGQFNQVNNNDPNAHKIIL